MLVNGHGVIADLLLADGATRSSLSRSDRFRSACMAADVARDGLAADASLIAEPTLLVDAVVRAAVELLIEVGAHVNRSSGNSGVTPLQQAGWHGKTEVAAMLLEAGVR